MDETPSQQLDAVLKVLANKEKLSYSVMDIYLQTSYDFKRIEELLRKLSDDGYALFDYTQSEITFNGRVFIDSLGYEKQYYLLNHPSPLYKLKTGLINVAALVAGLYYSLEIIRIYIQPIFQHFCHCQFVWQK